MAGLSADCAARLQLVSLEAFLLRKESFLKVGNRDICEEEREGHTNPRVALPRRFGFTYLRLKDNYGSC